MHSVNLQNLPNRGLLPATGAFGVCTKLKTYVALHSTNPDQEVETDLTNPLVRKLQKRNEERKAFTTPAKSTASRKRKCDATDTPTPANKSDCRQSGLSPAAKQQATAAAAAPEGDDVTQKTFSSAHLSRMQKKELQQILKAYGSAISGKKQELAERIMQAQCRRNDRVIVINQQKDEVVEHEVVPDDGGHAGRDRSMQENDQSSCPEETDEGFTRESI